MWRPAQVLLELLRPADAILEVGCGTSEVAARLHAEGFAVTSTDFSEARPPSLRGRSDGARDVG